MAGKNLGAAEHHKPKHHQQCGGVANGLGIDLGSCVQGKGDNCLVLPVQGQDPLESEVQK